MSVAGRRRRCCSYVSLWRSLVAVAVGAVAAAIARRSRHRTGARRAPAPRARKRASSAAAGASIASFPFQVALYNPAAGSPAAGFFCGGVIVDATHVITAAHCLAGGGHGRGSAPAKSRCSPAPPASIAPTPAASATRRSSVSVDPHYNPYTNDYDIGVVALAHPLWSGSTAAERQRRRTRSRRCRSTSAAAAGYGESSSTPATSATVSGWGDTNPAPRAAPSYPSALRASSVPLVSESLCQEEYAAIEQTITPRMICAGSARPRADSCYGDSGGPLVVDRDSPPVLPGTTCSSGSSTSATAAPSPASPASTRASPIPRSCASSPPTSATGRRLAAAAARRASASHRTRRSACSRTVDPLWRRRPWLCADCDA